jgi:hypothetical protein
VLRKLSLALAAATVTALGGVSVANAAVTFDPASGTGFVGKGDVQLAFGWNNAQLNNNAAGVDFEASTVSEQETTWTCDRDAGPQTQEKENTVTTTLQGVVTKVTRDNKKQITGFGLGGYDGAPVSSEEREGPASGSCPTGWTAVNLQSSGPVVTDGGLYVTHGATSVKIA